MAGAIHNLFRHVLIRQRLAQPGVAVALAAAAVIGGAGGIIPGGFLAQPGGAGLAAGASWGCWAFVFMSPLLGGVVAATLTASRFDHDVDRDLFLAGLSARQTIVDDALAAFAAAASMALCAACAGAIVGLGDAVSRHGAVLGNFSPLALIAAAGASAWWTVHGVCFATWLRSSLRACGLLIALLLVALAVLGTVRSQAAWTVLAASPAAILTLAANGSIGAARGLDTPVALAVGAATFWLIVLAGLAWRSAGRIRPPHELGRRDAS